MVKQMDNLILDSMTNITVSTLQFPSSNIPSFTLYDISQYVTLFLNIDTDGRLHTKIYDKRGDFNFPMFVLYGLHIQVCAPNTETALTKL